MALELRLDSARVAAGESVRGTVTALGDEDVDSLEVLLRFRERSRLRSATAFEISTGPLARDDLNRGDRRLCFELRVPEDALPAYRTKHGELWWEVDAHHAGRGGHDLHRTCRIEVIARSSGNASGQGSPRHGESRPARRSDWETKPMLRSEALEYARELTPQEAASLAQGHVPQEMEDRWFSYVENDALFIHHSWTGQLLFTAVLQRRPAGVVLTDVCREAHPGHLSEPDDVALEQFARVVSTLLAAAERERRGWMEGV
jgi:hypothetical protein